MFSFLFHSIFVFPFLSFFLSLFVSLFVFQSVCLSVCRYDWLAGWLTVRSSVSLSICPSICLYSFCLFSFYQSLRLSHSIGLSVYLSTRLHAWVSTSLSINVSVSLSHTFSTCRFLSRPVIPLSYISHSISPYFIALPATSSNLPKNRVVNKQHGLRSNGTRASCPQTLLRL